MCNYSNFVSQNSCFVHRFDMLDLKLQYPWASVATFMDKKQIQTENEFKKHSLIAVLFSACKGKSIWTWYWMFYAELQVGVLTDFSHVFFYLYSFPCTQAWIFVLLPENPILYFLTVVLIVCTDESTGSISL